MTSILPSVRSLLKTSSNLQMVLTRLASSHSKLPSSPVYELRMYSVKPKKFKAANELYDKNYKLRTQYSKLLGFWNSEIGDSVTQFVHIWEYDSLSHRRQVRTSMAGDEVWNTEFLPQLLPCIAQWKNALMVTSPGTQLHLDFNKDPSAVYLLDQVKVEDYNEPCDLKGSNAGELLVGRFSGILGASKTEYRLWRYSDIDQATEGSIQRATDSSFEGSTMLLYSAKFSPL